MLHFKAAVLHPLIFKDVTNRVGEAGQENPARPEHPEAFTPDRTTSGTKQFETGWTIKAKCSSGENAKVGHVSLDRVDR